MQPPEPVRRTSEIEDFTNLYFIHAIANRLTPVLARLHVHPNAVSVAGMVFGISAGFAYFRYHDTGYAIAGFVLMIAWHVMDGVDGQLARLTRTQSETGKILDGICDYVTFTAVYIALALRLSQQHGNLVWVLVIAAGICHAVQSAAYEVQRQEYDFWGWGRKSKELLRPDAMPREVPAASPAQRFSGLVHRLYVRVQFLAIGPSLNFHERLAGVLGSQPERAASIRRRYRDLFARPIRHWSVLSANYRTVGIFLCALLKAPLLYFFFEAVGFSLILAWLTARQHGRFALFLRSLDAAD